MTDTPNDKFERDANSGDESEFGASTESFRSKAEETDEGDAWLAPAPTAEGDSSAVSPRQDGPSLAEPPDAELPPTDSFDMKKLSASFLGKVESAVFSQHIEDYKIGHLLGSGGNGRVYFARNKHDKKACALKVFPKNKKSELAGVRQHRRRAHHNEHIVEVGPVLSAGDWYYYTMPLADDVTGEMPEDPNDYEPCTLTYTIANSAPMEVDQIIPIALQVLKGLEALHSKSGVHRDIKPDNIIKFGDVWKLADPGLLGGVRDAGLSGTRHYFPEGVTTNTPSTDLYAVGKTLYEMHSGRSLEDFPEYDADETSVDDGRSPRLEKIILKACDNSEGERYRSATKMRQSIEELAGLDKDGKQRHKRAVTWAWSALGVVAIACLFGFVIYLKPWDQNPAADSGALANSNGLPKDQREEKTHDGATSSDAKERPVAAYNFHFDHWKTPETLDVTRTKEDREDQYVGDILKSKERVDFGDKIVFGAQLTEPAYAYWIAFQPDGRIELCYPSAASDSPKQVSRPRYPLTDVGDDIPECFILNDAEGFYVFALVVSKSPLPAFDDWVKSKPNAPWEKIQGNADTVYTFDGLTQTATPVRGTGGQLNTKGGKVASKLFDWINGDSNSPDFVWLLAINIRK